MSGNQEYAQALARHVKAALMHLRQAVDLAELAGVDIHASVHDVPAAGLIRAAGEAVEDLDLWAINNARENGAAPTETYAHTERRCHAEGGSLPGGSWPRPPAADLADSEGLRQLSGYLEEADDREAARAERRAELASLRRAEAWEATARACVCPPGLCSRRHQAGEADPVRLHGLRGTGPGSALLCGRAPEPGRARWHAVSADRRARRPGITTDHGQPVIPAAGSNRPGAVSARLVCPPDVMAAALTSLSDFYGDAWQPSARKPSRNTDGHVLQYGTLIVPVPTVPGSAGREAAQ